MDVRRQVLVLEHQLARLTGIGALLDALPDELTFDMPPARPASELAEALGCLPARYVPECLSVCLFFGGGLPFRVSDRPSSTPTGLPFVGEGRDMKVETFKSQCVTLRSLISEGRPLEGEERTPAEVSRATPARCATIETCPKRPSRGSGEVGCRCPS